MSRLICGGNLISGFAHSRDLIYVSRLLKEYFTDEKVFQTLSICEAHGINTAILPNGQGIGFAVPINMAKKVINDIIKTGKVTRGYLGVGIQPLTPDLAKSFGLKENEGVLIKRVMKDGPAAKAGLKEGDVVRAGVALRAAKSKSGLVLGSLVDRLLDIIGLAAVAGSTRATMVFFSVTGLGS